jgi:hypothetical protein
MHLARRQPSHYLQGARGDPAGSGRDALHVDTEPQSYQGSRAIESNRYSLFRIHIDWMADYVIILDGLREALRRYFGGAPDQATLDCIQPDPGSVGTNLT